MLKRKDRILISAIELLNEEGINGITTKKLAQKQEVSEPALYRQFKGKQDILNHIIQEYAGYDEMIYNTILESSLKGKEAVMFYVSRYAEMYQNYHEMTTVIFSLDLYYYNDYTKNYMIDVLKKRIGFIEKLIEDSTDEFVLSEKFSPKEIASLINGTIYSLTYEWRMNDMTYPIDVQMKSVVERLL